MKLTLLVRILIPFVNKYVLHSNKSIHYNIFKEVVISFVNNPHPSDSELLKIINLAYNINKDGKRRRLTKEEYIDKYFS